MDAFITGSLAYGTPNPDSDVDLVIFCSEEVKAKLYEKADDETNRHHKKVRTIRFGDLNIIACTDQATYAAWRLATERLKAEAPVDSDTAKRVHKFCRNFDVETIYDSPELEDELPPHVAAQLREYYKNHPEEKASCRFNS